MDELTNRIDLVARGEGGRVDARGDARGDGRGDGAGGGAGGGAACGKLISNLPHPLAAPLKCSQFRLGGGGAWRWSCSALPTIRKA